MMRCIYPAVMMKAALFDFGGVILSSPFEAFNSYELEAGLPHNTIRLLNSTNPDSNAWARFERGELDASGFVEVFQAEAADAGFEVDATRILEGLRGSIRPEMVKAVEECGRRLSTAMLTNNFRDPAMAEPDPAIAAIYGMFDHVIESSVVGVRKPEPEFYRIACDAVGVGPEECVFLDDLGVNLKPARAMGMATIKVTDPALAISELEAVVGFSLR